LRKRNLIADYDGATGCAWSRSACRKTRPGAIGTGSRADLSHTRHRVSYRQAQARLRLIIDVFGADHIAEHQQVIAAVKALGYDTAPIRAIIYQFVTLTRAGEKGQDVHAQGHLRHAR